MSLVIISSYSFGISSQESAISHELMTPRIEGVRMTPIANKQYNLQIDIQSHQYNAKNWQLGFFMLKVFQNPSLKYSAQICENETANCVALKINPARTPQNINEVNQADLTSGHVVLFMPSKQFSLQAQHNYQIQINGLTYPPKNISMMPQSFFMLNESNVVTPLAVGNYQIAGYSESAVNATQAKVQQAHWDATNESLVLAATPIVPRPQLVNYYHGKVASKKWLEQPRSLSCLKALDICAKLQGNPEGYVLKIEAQQALIYSYTQTGDYYGRQSLAQLMSYYPKTIPEQTIIDYPQYRYRGIMLDVTRHFFDITQLQKLLNVMAAQKLNTLHLHLADDEGWRIQLGNYPELTEVSSKRQLGYKIGPSNLVDGNFDLANPLHTQYAAAESNYSGYYSESQIKNLIRYANTRGITIVPEIEMPGHARALKKAYPETLYDFKQPSDFLSVQGYNDNVLPIYRYGEDRQFTALIDGITAELAQLFSGQTTIYAKNQEVSLSGDEVPANAYPNVQNSASSNHQFFTALAAQLPGVQISGWQQLVQNDDGSIPLYSLNPDRIGHIWEWMPLASSNGVSGVVQSQNLLQMGYPVVADFSDYTYLDMRYSANFFEPGLYWATPQVDTWKAYSVAKQLVQFKSYPNFLGVEGALWTELVPSEEHLWYMLLPKMTGIAEAGWANSDADSWRDFSSRLGTGNEGFLAYLSRHYAVYYRGYPHGISPELPAK